MFFLLTPYQKDYTWSLDTSTSLNNIPMNTYAVCSPPRHYIASIQHFFNSLGKKYFIGGDINVKNTPRPFCTNNIREKVLNATCLLTLAAIKTHTLSLSKYWPDSYRKIPSKYPRHLCNQISLHNKTTSLNDPDHSSVLFAIYSILSNKPNKPSSTNELGVFRIIPK